MIHGSRIRLLKFAISTIIILPSLSIAYDVSDYFSIEGTVTAVIQHADLDNVFRQSGNEYSDNARGAAIIDVGINYHPTDNDEFQLTYSFAEGEAINGVEAFSLAPFADDLEEDLSDINSSDRYNLLEAWYKHTFNFSEKNTLGITAGIIGSSSYIDDNEYANDEISQFMNDIFVNNTLANLPDYDFGAAIEFESALWSFKVVAMESENEDRNDFKYYAAQIGHHVTTQWGQGNYRIYAFTTDNEFVNRDNMGEEKLSGFGLSIDQQINETVGMFARIGLQDDKTPVDHDQMISFGVSINGKQWNRADDHIGIGVAFLRGARSESSDIKDTKAFETYYRYMFSNYFDLTLDAQWIEDNIRNEKDPEGLLIGLRVNANF